MIDGFTSVQAVRHKGERKTDSIPPEETVPPPKPEEQRHRSVQAQKISIGHTALPSRHELVCYSCQYEFVVTGSLDKVFCPKCREQLETGDHTVEGEWKRDILTVGTVHIKSGAKVLGASIIATDIIIGGDCSEANLKPTRQIELETGAVVSSGVLNGKKIIIRSGARLVLDDPLRCGDLDIYGELQAKVMPTGIVVIHSGGMFRGELIASHLIVHDGGGLSAKLRIGLENTKSKPASKAKPLPATPAALVGKPAEKPAVRQSELQLDKPLKASTKTVVSNKHNKRTSKRRATKVK